VHTIKKNVIERPANKFVYVYNINDVNQRGLSINQICYRGYCYCLYYLYYYYRYYCNCIFIIVTILPVDFVAVRQKENLSIVHRLSIDWSVVAIILYLYLVIIASPVSTTRMSRMKIPFPVLYNIDHIFCPYSGIKAFFLEFYLIYDLFPYFSYVIKSFLLYSNNNTCNIINLLY